MSDNIERASAIFRDLNLSDRDQASELFALVYDELRNLASQHLHRERPGHTLQPTALVHEAYLRLAAASRLDWQGRAHFFGIAARAMRQVLVDHARRRRASKRGGEWRRVTLNSQLIGGNEECDVVELDFALTKLSSQHEQLGRLVELRFFAGFTLDETADILGVSRRKAAKDWSVARLILGRELQLH
jgi:RNA polymerase sigma factor (TIGR02999 family)